MKNKIGENVKNYRIKAGLKQQDLSDKVGITATTLSRIESGNGSIKLDTLIKIGNVLGVSTERLLFGEDAFVLNSEVMEKVLKIIL